MSRPVSRPKGYDGDYGAVILTEHDLERGIKLLDDGEKELAAPCPITVTEGKHSLGN